jgi:hypothetical protein
LGARAHKEREASGQRALTGGEATGVGGDDRRERRRRTKGPGRAWKGEAADAEVRPNFSQYRALPLRALFACLIIYTFQLVFSAEQCFSLITNQRTVLSTMVF